MVQSYPPNSRRNAQRPEFLEQFRQMNPYLEAVDQIYRCGSLWDLLTLQHRYDPNCCGVLPDDGVGDCFADHMEMWRDQRSGLTVAVAHPYCEHSAEDNRPQRLRGLDGQDKDPDTRDSDHYESHKRSVHYLKARGLGYLVSNGSWYSEHASLIVIARRDLLDEIFLAQDPGGLHVRHGCAGLMTDRQVALLRQRRMEGKTQEAAAMVSWVARPVRPTCVRALSSRASSSTTST